MVGDWKKWRYSLFEIKDLTSRNSGKSRLEDSLRNDRNREWLYKKRDNNGDDWLDVPVMQEDLRMHYERLLVVYELIPMLKPFAGQIRLVPGNEGMSELPLIKGLFEKTTKWGPSPLGWLAKCRMSSPRMPMAIYVTQTARKMTFSLSGWGPGWPMSSNRLTLWPLFLQEYLQVQERCREFRWCFYSAFWMDTHAVKWETWQ